MYVGNYVRIMFKDIRMVRKYIFIPKAGTSNFPFLKQKHLPSIAIKLGTIYIYMYI
jgi:hypothetical protein